MKTDGIDAVFVTTHNWGRAAKFFQTLGLALDFETDHHSGKFVSGDGPYVFVAEIPPDQETGVEVLLGVPGEELDPSLDVVTPFEDTHWGTRDAVVRDPDGRTWRLTAPAAPAPPAPPAPLS